jgi:hypothetical protein
MSDQIPAAEHRENWDPRRQPRSEGHGRFATGVRSTIRFFAPSLIVGLFAPFVFPAIRSAARPFAKGLIKGALTLTESAKEGAAAAQEQMSDLLAEVKAEREQEAAAATSVAALEPVAPDPQSTV